MYDRPKKKSDLQQKVNNAHVQARNRQHMNGARIGIGLGNFGRSEERRVGKEC